jgi:hypothetical protein
MFPAQYVDRLAERTTIKNICSRESLPGNVELERTIKCRNPFAASEFF